MPKHTPDTRPDGHTLLDLIAPVIAQAETLEHKPHVLVVTPGDDWPDKKRRPESMVFIPNLPQELIDIIPADTMARIRKDAFDIAHELKLDPNQRIDMPRRRDNDAPASDRNNPARPRPSKKDRSWAKDMVAGGLVAAAGLVSQAGNITPPSSAPIPPAAVSTMDGIGFEQRRQRTAPRDGYTIVEVLVVIGILSTIAALTLPAVMRARDAANEMSYRSNMRQVGMAIHNFESDHRHLPYSVSMVANEKGVLIPHTWVADILPYIEQDALHRQYNQRLSYDAQTADVQNAKIAVLNHPAHPLEPGRMRMAALSTSGLAATNPPDINGQHGITKDYILGNTPADFNVVMPPQWVMNGAGRWQQLGKSTFASITDGASNTAMIGAHVHEEGNRDPWLADPANPGGKTRITGLMFGPELGQARAAGGLTGNVSESYNYVTNHVISHDGSGHTGKHTVLFADGSVRSIAPTGPRDASFYTAEAKRWQEMVNKKDGKSPDDDLNR